MEFNAANIKKIAEENINKNDLYRNVIKQIESEAKKGKICTEFLASTLCYDDDTVLWLRQKGFKVHMYSGIKIIVSWDV